MGGDARLILVLGMHRSGTSAFARALQVFGAALGEDLLPAHPCNPKGFFEDGQVYAFNKALLAHLGRTWRDVPPPGAQEQRALATGEWGADALALLREKTAGHPLFGLKDPRISILLPFWRPVLAAAGVAPQCVICLRAPDSVAHSLARRDGLPAETSCALWAAHTLGAFTGSAGLPRCCVAYEALLREPAAQLDRLGAALHLAADAAERQTFLTDFLDSTLCHHRPDKGDASAGNGPYATLARDIHAGLCADDTAPLSPDSPAATRLTGQWLSRLRRLPPPAAGDSGTAA